MAQRMDHLAIVEFAHRVAEGDDQQPDREQDREGHQQALHAGLWKALGGASGFALAGRGLTGLGASRGNRDGRSHAAVASFLLGVAIDRAAPRAASFASLPATPIKIGGPTRRTGQTIMAKPGR